MLTPEKAEELAKNVISNYIEVANPIEPGDTRKLLTKLQGVLSRHIQSIDELATRRIDKRLAKVDYDIL